MLPPEDVICKILQEYMELPGRVVKYAQGWHAPKDWNVYIIVSASEAAKPIGKKTDTSFIDNVFYENSYVVMQGGYSVEIISRDKSALERKEEILMAINSGLALRTMESNNLKIQATGRFMDLSALEGASILCRYRTTLTVNYIKIKKTKADFFDKFSQPKILKE